MDGLGVAYIPIRTFQLPFYFEHFNMSSQYKESSTSLVIVKESFAFERGTALSLSLPNHLKAVKYS